MPWLSKSYYDANRESSNQKEFRNMSKLKIVVVVSDKPEVDRIDVKESDGEGNFAALEHPWCQRDLAKIQRANKALTLLARGISDTEDVVRIANMSPRSGRRKGTKPAALNGSSSRK
jgi:hypothetical protein